jgi:1,6-anhydro-N-acetylmuramate kinase
VKQIKLSSTLAGVNGVLNPGKHFVEDQLADDLVAGGYAEHVVIIEKAVVAAPEKAVVKPAEKAVVKPPEVSAAAAAIPAAAAAESKSGTVPSPWKK